MRYLFSFYSDSGKIALQSILAHKLRAFLTLIGIIIGVAAVVVVGASVSGLNTYVTERVAKLLGANHFMMARIAFSGHMSDEEFERINRRNKRLNKTICGRPRDAGVDRDIRHRQRVVGVGNDIENRKRLAQAFDGGTIRIVGSAGNVEFDRLWMGQFAMSAS